MSYDPSDYRLPSRGDDCPGCGAEHPDGHKFAPCDHPHCEYTGCYLCLAECGIATHGNKRFCSNHLNPIHLDGLDRDLLACAECESEDMDEECDICGTRAAA